MNLSATLNLWNNDFPLGYHADEPKKVFFVQSGQQDFHHPLLLLGLIRAANRLLGVSSDHQIVVLGRTVVGLLGTCGVALSYCLARPTLAPTWALLVALAMAVSPIWVIHANYLKEDVLLTSTLLLCLLCFLRLTETQSLPWSLAFGIALGLAGSSHYKALVLVPVACCAPLLYKVEHLRRFYACLGLSLLISGCLFLFINWPLLGNPSNFVRGMRHSASIVFDGFEVSFGPWPFFFCFHATYSLIPGLGFGVVAVALVWIGYAAACWRRLVAADRLLLVYAVVFYLVVEISPLKPAPDYARYVLPIVPVVLYFSVKGAELLCRQLPGIGKMVAIPLFGALLIGLPVWDTIRLGYYLNRDTRKLAAEQIDRLEGTAVIEQYAGLHPNVWSAGELTVEELRRRGTAYLVVSSFMYDRYFLGSRLANQPPSVYQRHQQYERLFSLPYTEIRPGFKSFAFSNPVIRIIDIREPAPRASGPERESSEFGTRLPGNRD